MKIFGRKVGIVRKRNESAAAASVASDTSHDTSVAPPQPKSMSSLSALVTQFVADNARKTHDSIEDEKERQDFVFDLREMLESVRDGKEPAPRRSVAKRSSIIDFFAQTTESTLRSIEDEEERISFEEDLTRALHDNFENE